MKRIQIHRLLIVFLIVVVISCIGYFSSAKTKNNTITTKEISEVKKESQPINQQNEDYLYLIEVNGKYGYINKMGKVVIEPQFDEARDFSEGLAAVKLSEKWGYINTKKELIIKPLFDIADAFSDGVAVAGFINKDNSEKWGYINKNGNFIIKPQFSHYYYKFNDNLVPISKDDYFCALINKKGELAINPSELGYSNSLDNFCENYSEGLLPVSYDENKEWGYIDKTGKLVLKIKTDWQVEKFGDIFNPVNQFHEGLAKVFINGKWGYINKKGEITIKSKFGYADDFSNGLAAVSSDSVDNCTFNQDNNKCLKGYIDKTGKFIIEPKYVDAEPFIGELARISFNKYGIIDKSEYGYINKDGNLIWYSNQE